MTPRFLLLTPWMLGGCFLAPVRADDPITVESRFSAPSCRVGQEITWTLEIVWPGKATDHHIDRVELPPFTGFTVLDHRTTDAITVEGATPRYRRRDGITLQAMEIGSRTVGPARVDISTGTGERKALASASLSLQVGQSLERMMALGAGCLALAAGLVLGLRRLGRRPPRLVEAIPQDETRDFDHVMRAPNHREFFGRALELLRVGFGRRLGTELPATREAFIQSLKELGIRDAVVHLTDQIWKELDEGRFNPESPSGRDRDRVVFQIQDIFKNLALSRSMPTSGQRSSTAPSPAGNSTVPEGRRNGD